MMINRWRIGVMGCVLAGAMANLPAQAQDDDAEVDAKQAQRWAALLAAPAPNTGTPEQRAAAHIERIRAARMLDQPDRERAEIDAGLQAVGADHRAAYGLLNRQAEYNADRGDFIAALRAREQALRVAATPGQELNELTLIASIQSVLRDRSGAAASLARAQQTLQRLRAVPNWARFGDLWQAKLSHASALYQRLYGSLAESEAASRACIASMRTHLGKTPDGAEPSFFFLVDCTRDLVATLLKSGRLDQAGIFAVELRELARDYAERQGRAAFAARLAPMIVQVAIERGRFDEAGATIDTAVARLRQSGAGEGSLHLAHLRLLRGQIEMLQRRWAEADEVFTARRAGLLAQRDQAQRLGVLLPEWAYVQLQLGQKDKALDMLNRIVTGRTERFGSDTLPTWEARGFRAIALAANGQRDAALREFAAAVPRIIELGHGERASADAGLWRSTRLNWVFEGYLSLLAEVASRGERPGGLDPVDEGFRLSDLIRGSTVQRALATAASRAVITDPALADLARQYHDQQRDVASLSDGLGNLLSRGRVSAMDGVVARIRGDLETLRGEQARVQRTIAQRFPAYASLIEPRPPGIAEVQAMLRPGEALLSVLTGASGSYVWAVPKSGAAAFAVVPVGATQVARQVAGLRRTLDPTGLEDATRIRPYPFETAHALYRQFIAPVEATLQGATSLIVVLHGELGQLPFAALTTAPFVSASPAPGFDDYAQAPWLAKRMATSQLPSTTALLALRNKASAGRAERAYVAFADPLFSLAASPPPLSATPAATPVATTATLAARNPPIRATAAAGLTDDGRGPTSRMHLLEPLPETAAEVREIAQLLGADEQRDLFLRERASERNVKTADLMRYRTVMFATHGLQPGQLPGLSQPALALSNPSTAGPGQPDGEDGLLMLDEILGLRLQADWVVLSACSTASPDALSAEAISGLGRAFFFAGARALLVTGWPIESQSARLLTAATFRSSAEPVQRSRAEALRQASLALMRQHADTSPRLGYAHPMFWAAFVIVGDGG